MRFRFPIDGAVSFAKMERIVVDGEEGIRLPTEVDKEYTSAVLGDDIGEDGDIWLLCSKDFINYEIAVAVYINDTKYTANDFENMRMDTFFCLLNGKDYRVPTDCPWK